MRQDLITNLKWRKRERLKDDSWVDSMGNWEIGLSKEGE